MTRKIDRTLITTTLVCLLPIILSFVVYNDLPKQIAIHWDYAGNPDNFAPKSLTVWGLPLFLAGMNIFTHIVINGDPKKANASSVLKQFGKWITPLLSVILVPITLFKALGYPIQIEVIAPVLVGIMIIIIGNYLPKCKQNYTIGIKLPWTLNSHDNWNKTHHLSGYLWIIGGLCIAGGGFLNGDWLPITLITTAILVVVPFMYSYFLYKQGI
ncbi:putative membrane protein [Metabacillus crassostreae]|uniref:SdpI family protein n=1 Tax=Metabacillus crassostreae TaxID=929098 RepID=UPI00195A70EB|nr:SdpI family protein [Metabacillus crassostreae]MBM7602828.1 putative membrane protein [Metabacillus crassostreae]